MKIDLTINDDGRPKLTVNGTRYICRPMETVEPELAAVTWVMPVGEGDYPSSMWYAATWHDLTGARNGGYKHTGVDLNLDVAPWGDVERALDLGIYAVADGVVTYSTLNWSGVPMVVIRHEHEGFPLWVRYAHISPRPLASWPWGEVVAAGQCLGGFADWPERGDHLHFDMALDEFTREWLDPRIRWLDPVPVLKSHHDPAIVDAMLRKGG